MSNMKGWHQFCFPLILVHWNFYLIYYIFYLFLSVFVYHTCTCVPVYRCHRAHLKPRASEGSQFSPFPLWVLESDSGEKRTAIPFTHWTIQPLRALSILKPKKNFSLQVCLTSDAIGDLSSAWREEQKRKITLGRDLKSLSTCNYVCCQARHSDRGRKDG